MERGSVEKEIHRKTSWKKGGERVAGKERRGRKEATGEGGTAETQYRRKEKKTSVAFASGGEKESEGEGEESRRRGRERGWRRNTKKSTRGGGQVNGEEDVEMREERKREGP